MSECPLHLSLLDPRPSDTFVPKKSLLAINSYTIYLQKMSTLSPKSDNLVFIFQYCSKDISEWRETPIIQHSNPIQALVWMNSSTKRSLLNSRSWYDRVWVHVCETLNAIHMRDPMSVQVGKFHACEQFRMSDFVSQKAPSRKRTKFCVPTWTARV